MELHGWSGTEKDTDHILSYLRMTLCETELRKEIQQMSGKQFKALFQSAIARDFVMYEVKNMMIYILENEKGLKEATV